MCRLRHWWAIAVSVWHGGSSPGLVARLLIADFIERRQDLNEL